MKIIHQLKNIYIYIKILTKKYDNIENYNILIELHQLTKLTLAVIFTYKKIFEITYDFQCDIKTQYCSVILYIHAPVHIYGVTYYSATTTSDVVVAYNTSGPWNLMLSGHANY